MSHNWDQRYFDNQPRLNDDSPDIANNNRRRPQFHEVFGNRRQRRGGFRGGIQRNYCSQPGASRRSGDAGDVARGYHQHEANDQRDLPSPGRKRPAFEQRDPGGMKRRKYVPGGRIPKFKRVEEYQGDTYCHICERGFRDIVAKTVHDRSKQHRRNLAYTRQESQAENDDNTSTRQEPGEDRRKNLEDGMKAFLSLDINSLPKPFREWMDKSLAAARKEAEDSKDSALLQAVHREVVEVYRVNDKNCTLRRVCWARKQLVTGRAYRDSHPMATQLPAVPDSKLFVRCETMSRKVEEPIMPKEEGEPTKSKKEEELTSDKIVLPTPLPTARDPDPDC